MITQKTGSESIEFFSSADVKLKEPRAKKEHAEAIVRYSKRCAEWL